MAQLSVRSFQPGDETTLCWLYNRAYGQPTGSDRLTPGEWYRLFVDNRDIGTRRILVACEPDIQGYLAYATAPHPFFPNDAFGGIVYELGLRAGKHGRAAGARLMASFFEAVRREGVENIYAVVPNHNKRAWRALSRSGFARMGSACGITLDMIDFHSFCARREQMLRRRFPGVGPVSFRLYQNYSRRIVTCGKDGRDEFTILDHHRAARAVEVQCGMLEMSDILLGGYSPIRAVLSGRVKVRPAHRAIVIVRLLHALAYRGKWAIPYVEWR